jgi:hypothetical protein
MFRDRAAASAFAAVFLVACGDSNLGTPGQSSLGALDGGSPSAANDGGNSFLAAGQCPPVGSSICPNDPGATQLDVDNCNTGLDDPTCGSDYKLYLECAGKNVTCDASGQSDSSAIQAACGNQAQTYQSCATGAPKPDAG